MAAIIRKFNWADATDSDDDVLSSPEQTLIIRGEKGGENAQLQSTPVRQKAPAPAVPTSTRTCGGLSEDDNNSSSSANESPALNAVRELDFSDGSAITPLRLCQEVTIQAAIPYKLKSVWNANNNGSNGSTPSAKFALNIINNNSSSSVVSSSTPLSSTPRDEIAASIRPAPLRKMNRAVDELANVLRANDGSLPYDELMVKAQWRSRFQPSFGSLFTFIKRNREIFRYKQSVVELMQEASIVTELLKINWPSSVTVSPSKI